jgi:MFS family permease
MTTLVITLSKAVSLPTLLSLPRSGHLLVLSRILRLFAFGTTSLTLIPFLSALSISTTRIGLFMTLTLLGDVLISFLLTLYADSLGRRLVMMLGSVLMALSGLVFATFSNYWILLFASVIGVISPSGNEIGPFRAVEESALAGLCGKDERAAVFTWYNLLGTAGAAVGQLGVGWFVGGISEDSGGVGRLRWVFWGYAIVGVMKLGAAWALGGDVEVDGQENKTEVEESVQLQEEHELDGEEERSGGSHGDGYKSVPAASTTKAAAAPASKRKAGFSLPAISASSRLTVLKLSALFGIDAFASGLITTTWISYYFTSVFHLDAGLLGTLFFTTSLIAAGSNFLAIPLANRIGLVRTMVFTHLPSTFFLALIPSTSNSSLAMVFLILRSCIQSMDQAPRQAFLSQAVLASERTAVMGVINVVKTAAASGAPSVTGYMAGAGAFGVVFVIAGAMKASYDLGMLWMFREFKSPEDG